MVATCGQQTAASPFAVKLAEAQAGTVATSTATTSEMKQHAVMQLSWVALRVEFLFIIYLISRLLKIIGLFCKKALQNRRYSSKETYHFQEPANRSHPIIVLNDRR